MQINMCSGGVSQYSLKSKTTSNASKTFGDEVVSQANETMEAPKLTEAEEMENFKKEVYLEIAEIHKNLPPYQLSTSIHITDGAFKRMKEDPEFKDEIMKLLRRDAQPIVNTMGLGFHVTTTITDKVDGYVAFSANVYPHDSQETKEDKKADAKKRTEDAFYYKLYEKNDSSNEVDFEEIWLQQKYERQLVEQSQMRKPLSHDNATGYANI